MNNDIMKARRNWSVFVCPKNPLLCERSDFYAAIGKLTQGSGFLGEYDKARLALGSI